ncbi:MAG: glycosyltransferase family 4 protein [Acidimicrobiales bacterium]
MSRKPTVGFNLLWLVPGVVGGTEEATTDLLTSLASDPPDDIDYRLYALAPFAAAHPEVVERFPTRLLRLTGRLKPLRVTAEGTWLAAMTKRDRIDLVHHGGGTMPPGPRRPSVVTIHDLQPFDLPEYFGAAKRTYLQWAVPRAAHHASLILTLSEFVRQRVIERFDAHPDHVRAVRAGVRPMRPPDIPVTELRNRYELPERWFVYPAITYPHKNHVAVIRAFAEVAAKDSGVALVLTGRPAGSEPQIREDIARLGLGDVVRRTGRVPRGDVLGLIAGAAGLVFPSRYEGFGLPVLEAMALDTPVVASSTTALPEVVGEAGLLVDPDDIEGWAAAMLEVLSGDRTQDLVDKGRRQAAKLSWAAATAATVQAHRDVLKDLDDVRRLKDSR